VGWPVVFLDTLAGRAQPGHAKIALDITAVDVDLFFFTYPVQLSYNDRLSL